MVWMVEFAGRSKRSEERRRGNCPPDLNRIMARPIFFGLERVGISDAGRGRGTDWYLSTRERTCSAARSVTLATASFSLLPYAARSARSGILATKRPSLSRPTAAQYQILYMLPSHFPQ